MIIALLHGGPRNGETFHLPWATYDLHVPRAEEAPGGTYRLRGPYRGQENAHYDYSEVKA